MFRSRHSGSVAKRSPSCEHFLRKHNRKYNSAMLTIPRAVLDHMLAYDWPGNIRELENVIKRLVILGNDQQIIDELTLKIESRKKSDKMALDASQVEVPTDEAGGMSLKNMSRNLTSTAEKEVILRALQQTQWNRKQAATMLNVSYKTLLNKIRKLDIK